MSTRAYTVGSVLFILSPGNREVLPVRVVEEVYRKNLSGQSTSYIVQTTEGTSHSLEDLEGTIFSSTEEVRATMYDLLRRKVDEVVDVTHQLAKDTFMNSDNDVYEDQHVPVVPTIEEGQEIVGQRDNLVVEEVKGLSETVSHVTLPDGSVAKVSVNLPEGFEY